MTYAKVIADSVSPQGDRLTTLEVRMHRFVLAEFNTHRVFSRNSASSRAIPFPKQVERVLNDPALPVVWASEQKGMQGGGEILNPQKAEATWLNVRDEVVRGAQYLASLGVHKSIVNRLLEPFMWHTVIVTATEWDGFWHQRLSELAQPEIRVAAEHMKEAYDVSTPARLGYDEWHLPYIDDSDRKWALVDAQRGEAAYKNPNRVLGASAYPTLYKISAARCARVSYLTHDGTRSHEADLALYDRLVNREGNPDDPIHWSPLEHVAIPCRRSQHDWPGCEHKGNFVGWDQLRHIVGGRGA